MTSNRPHPPHQFPESTTVRNSSTDASEPHWPALLASWLIEAKRPTRALQLGSANRSLLISMCGGLRRLGPDARCLSVRVPSIETESDRQGSHRVAVELASAFGSVLEVVDENDATPTDRSSQPPIDLLWVSDPQPADDDLDLDGWLHLLAPGSTIVLTSSSGRSSQGFARTKDLISARYPSLSATLGKDGSVLIAQTATGGDEGGLVAFSDLSRAEAASASASHDVVAAALSVWTLEATGGDDLDSGPEALVTALRAYRTLAAHLMLELSDARADLVAQAESGRLELASVTNEFLDRLDVLSAKISTSAGRYQSQLEEKDRLLDDMEKRMLDYAGRAATAQSVIDDLHSSSSWRVTAPLRLVSRVMARRRRPVQD